MFEVAAVLAVSGKGDDDGVRKLRTGFYRNQNAAFHQERESTRRGPRDCDPSRRSR